MPLPRILSPYPLRRHRADLKQRRVAHRAAAIGEIACAALIAVDSRYRSHDEPPLLHLLEDRQRERGFPAARNPEFAVD